MKTKCLKIVLDIFCKILNRFIFTQSFHIPVVYLLLINIKCDRKIKYNALTFFKK